MPFTPDAPFPKSQGDNIRSKDWNDAVNELRRIDTAKLDLAGGRVTGPLAVDGSLGVGTPTPKYPLSFPNTLGDKVALWGNADQHYGFGIQGSLLQIHTDTAGADIAFGFGSSASFTETMRITGAGRVGIGTNAPDRALTIQDAGSAYLNVKANNGTFQVLLGADAGGGILSTMTNHDLQLRAGNNQTKMIIKANGNVGIGTTEPEFALEVNDRIRLRQSGHTAGLWLWQNTPKADRAFIGMANDDAVGLYGVGLGWGLTMNTTSGNVGLGTINPTEKLEINGGLKILGNSNPIRFTSAWSAFPDGALDRAEICNDTGTYKTLMIVGNKSGGEGRRVSVWDRLEVNGFLKTDKLQLGNKWLLSGVGDAEANDDWLRLKNANAPRDYYGGFAALRLWSQGGVVQGSDVRLKKEVAPLGDVTGGLLNLRGVRFKWRDDALGESGQIGLIAQEVEQVFPELVEVGPDGMKGILHAGLIAPLIEAVKQQHAEIAELRAELRRLQKPRARQAKTSTRP
jgi:hypothetical protein